MPRMLVALVGGVALLIGLASGSLAEPLAAHRIILPQDLDWKPAPPAFPPGSETVVLFGDPAREGPFVVRVRARKGYRLPLHIHPVSEILTVLSGVVSYQTGREGRATSRLPPGGFSVMPPGVEHSVLIEEDAVVQINAVGPWRIDYVDPKDDPRRKGE